MKNIVEKRSSGFTLIELLVVISIIGVLSTIAMTSMGNARKKANKVSFQTTSKSIQASALMCCESQNSTLLESATDGALLPGDGICRYKNDYSNMNTFGNYPHSGAIGSVTIVSDCNEGAFSITLTPGTDNTGGWTTASCNNNECSYASS